MTISIVTLFPQMFESVFNYSILKRAQDDGKITIRFINLKEHGIGKHKIVDDTPYGGGVGMVLKVDVVDSAIQATRMEGKREKVFLMDPKGTPYSQSLARDLAQLDHVILICGHYEGFDERVLSLVDGQISIGDYVLSGGEIPAMVVTESIARLVPGVLKKEEAHMLESYSEHSGILEHAQYTRPQEYKGMQVPEVLLSGNFAKIEEFRSQSATAITEKNRPDLLKK